MSKNTTKTDELAENSPFNVTTERKGRGRRQINSKFVRSENSFAVSEQGQDGNGNQNDQPKTVRLTPEQEAAKKRFYQASYYQELQFRQLAREWGCYR